MECPICYCKSSKVVECSHCLEKCCKRCYSTYILGNESNNCMFCEEPQTKGFVRYHIMKKSIPDLKSREASKLLRQEKFLLPETQVQLELEQIEEDVLFLVTQLDSMLNIKASVSTLSATSATKDIFRITIEESIKRVREQLSALNGDSSQLNHMKVSKKMFVCSFPCSATGCNGIVLKTKCGSCGVSFCNRCREVKEEDHVCKEENVETVNAIKQDTKPCPKCKVSIFKIEGCDQMFCTICNTGFSWRNGKILNTSILHNPHFFEWMRNQTEDARGFGCERRDWNTVSRKLMGFSTLAGRTNPDCTAVRSKLRNVNRTLGEVFEYLERQDNNADEAKRRNLRTRFIRNSITEDAWKKCLKLHITKMEKDDVVVAILTTFRDVMVDIILSTDSLCENLPGLLARFKDITAFTLGQMKKELVETLSLKIPTRWKTSLTDLLE